MPLTFVVYLLDRTGSMGRTKPASVAGFNSFVTTLKNADADGNIRFTLVQFYGRGVDTACQRVRVEEVAPLSPAAFQPKGRTPLIDAACKTIKAVERALFAEDGGAPSARERPADAPRIVLCIQSDGNDNASVEYDWPGLKELVTEKRALGWQLVFLCADCDPELLVERMGLEPGNAIAYSWDVEAARNAFAAVALRIAAFAEGPAEGVRPSEPPQGEAHIAGAPHPASGPREQKIPDEIAV